MKPAKQPFVASRLTWPIAIHRKGQVASPVWVWGDRELAKEIVELLNSGERDRMALNGTTWRMRSARGKVKQ
jgi:hypothetical protein